MIFIIYFQLLDVHTLNVYVSSCLVEYEDLKSVGQPYFYFKKTILRLLIEPYTLLV